jgi:hypothetical protein
VRPELSEWSRFSGLPARHMRGADGGRDGRVLSRMYVEPLNHRLPHSLARLAGMMSIAQNRAVALTRGVCAMNRPSEIPEDKLQAVLVLIKRIDEQIGKRSTSKAKNKSALKPRMTSSVPRASD